MNSVSLFQWIGSMLDAALSAYVATTSSRLIEDLHAPAVGLTTIYFLVVAYLTLVGVIETPIKTYFMTMAKVVFVGSFALNAGTYTSWVVAGIQGLEEGLAHAFAGSDGAAGLSVYTVVDDALTKGWLLAADVWERSGSSLSIGRALGETVLAAVIAMATFMIGVPAGATVVVAKCWLSITLGIGPFFILCAMWPVSRQFFDRWMGAVFHSIFEIGLIGTVLLLAMKLFTAAVSTVNTDSESQSLFFAALQIAGVAAVMLRMVYHASNVAAQLSGGMSSAAITLRDMIASASGTVSGAARAVNPTSTRLDPRTGHQTSSTRLEHLAMGRSVFARSPAYRQGVMERLNEAWRRPGGQVDKVKEKL